MRNLGLHCCADPDQSGSPECSYSDDFSRCRVARFKASKYKAKRTEIDGIKFDSKAESEYYVILKRLKAAHIIKDFELQPKAFVLQDGFIGSTGEKVQPIRYRADFKIIYKDDTEEIVDIKGGFLTDVFEIKWKMFDFRYRDIKKRIVYKKGKNFSWVPCM